MVYQYDYYNFQKKIYPNEPEKWSWISWENYYNTTLWAKVDPTGFYIASFY